MGEQRGLTPDDLDANLPSKIVELLARPRLTDLPENPVGRILEALRSVFPDFVDQDLPEVVDLSAAARSIASDALYIEPHELHRLDRDRILRYDLTLPLLRRIVLFAVVGAQEVISALR